MKLPLLCRLTLGIAIAVERVYALAWSLHERAMRREIDRMPARPLDPEAVDRAWERVSAAIERAEKGRAACIAVEADSVRFTGVDLRDSHDNVIASGPGMLGFWGGVDEYMSGRAN